MHARRDSLVRTVTDGVRRLVLLAGVFFFALSLTTLALHGSGPRTVDLTYPDGPLQQTEATAVEAPSS